MLLLEEILNSVNTDKKYLKLHTYDVREEQNPKERNCCMSSHDQ